MEGPAQIDVECAMALERAYEQTHEALGGIGRRGGTHIGYGWAGPAAANHAAVGYHGGNSAADATLAHATTPTDHTQPYHAEHDAWPPGAQADAAALRPYAYASPLEAELPGNAQGAVAPSFTAAADTLQAEDQAGRAGFEGHADRRTPCPSVAEMFMLVGQLNLLLHEIVTRGAGTFSEAWMQAAHSFQFICEDFFLVSSSSILALKNMPMLPDELCCAAAILEFIGEVNGVDCGYLMQQYGLMATKLFTYVKNVAKYAVSRARAARACRYHSEWLRPWHFAPARPGPPEPLMMPAECAPPATAHYAAMRRQTPMNSTCPFTQPLTAHMQLPSSSPYTQNPGRAARRGRYQGPCPCPRQTNVMQGRAPAPVFATMGANQHAAQQREEWASMFEPGAPIAQDAELLAPGYGAPDAQQPAAPAAFDYYRGDQRYAGDHQKCSKAVTGGAVGGSAGEMRDANWPQRSG